ncbi:MAG: hypothetical protein NNA20_11775 [Nitrospira sp.]|nr:hypothetical protein [Nitrospira sp.]MCP9443262.1 hypothetical protein [Nitrospira sp.]
MVSVLTVWMPFNWGLGHAETIRFNACDLENQQAAWAPQEVTIRQPDKAEEELIFSLNNPTERTHAFEAPGLLEQTNAQDGSPLTKPLRVTVAPGETMEVVIRFAPLEGNTDPSCLAGAVCYRFYCPLHRGDDDPGGIIHLVH